MVKELTLNKAVAAFIGVAMVVGLASALAVSRAHAVTLAELVELFIALEVIPADKADEARTVLSSQDATTPSLVTTMSCSFTRNLSVGDTGTDVMDLQKLLNAKGFTIAVTGAGSNGQESSYYGQLTAAAVSKMQEAFASEILSPLGLTMGTGYFGASTRAKANALCAASTPTTPTTPGDEDEDEDTDSSDLSGEASLVTAEIASADDDEIEEGAEDAVVAEFTLEFEDGDAVITRMDVSIDDGSADAWDVLESVSLWVDGEKIAEEAADDKDEYLNETQGTLRFSGLDFVAMEDEEVVVQVAVNVVGNADSTDIATAFNASVDEIRYKDAEDVSTTDGGTGDLATPTTVSFTIEEAGAEDELFVKSNSSDPDASTIKVEDDTKSDWITVFVFDLDTDDSVNDIELTTVPVTVYAPVGTTTYNILVDDARLVIDGTTIDSTSADVLNPNTDTATINFDVDGDVVIEAGDRVKAELQLRFKALTVGDEGATVQAEVTSTNADAIVAEGADDLEAVTPNQLQGSASGEVHTLRTTGIYAEVISVDETSKSDGTVDDAVGEYIVKFDVTAFETDYYVSSVVGSAVGYVIENSTGATETLDGLSTNSAVLSASVAKETGQNAYKVAEGDTVTFTLKVTFDPNGADVAGDYRVQLNTVDFGSDATTPTDQTAHTVTPAEDFETGYLYLNV